ncbi:hypothetical protein AURDEDRAFT_165859 [Auricularia subglabra TFB-10046 SS5]|nr:hypothetical protein AURDEDRAFT_165859 [Auricularia subglabra TFB-10046 SS5]
MDSENDGAVDSDGAHSVGNTLIIEAMRSMIGDLRTHVDGKFSDHQVQAQDNAEKVTLLTQTVAALQDQVAELQNRRERSRSRSSRASSMPEEQKLARRAEKRPEVPSAPPPGSSAVVPVIAQPLQGDPLSPVVFAAQFDEVDQFNGSFSTIPADLYAEDGWSFSNAQFLEAQNIAQDNAEKVTLLTQTVAALQDQVAELQNRRERSRSRSSRASSMPEEQKLARRAEKRPEVPSAPPPGSSAVVPVIAQPLQGDPLSPVVFAAQFDEVDQFNGSFSTIPADLPSASTALLPVSTVGGSSAASTNVNKPLATTPARPGAIYPTADDKNCWRCGKLGHIGRNCPDIQAPAVTARATAGALVHFNSTPTENPREIVIHDDLADHAEHRGDDAFGQRAATSAIKVGSAETPRDEYAALGYTAQDIEAVYDEPDTSRWVFNDDDDE